MTPARFVASLPEFADPARFPDSQISRFIGLAGLLLDPDAWGGLLDYGTGLLVAHHLSIWRENADSSANKGGIGIGVGVVASKEVGPVSVSFDAGDALVQGAAQYNLTTYGIQFYQLSRQVGMGAPSQVNGGVLAVPYPNISTATFP